jgi:hypothetical protein
MYPNIEQFQVFGADFGICYELVRMRVPKVKYENLF